MNLRLLSLIAIVVTSLSSNGAEVRLYGFTKGQVYQQSGPTKATTPGLYQFHAFVELTRPNAASSVTLRWPNGSSRSLTNYSTSWRILEGFPTASALNTAAPNGTYTYTMNTGGDGVKTIQLTLSADFYPEIPHLVNFAAAQEIDHTKNFTLTLGPSGAGANDFMHVRVEEGSSVVWETPSSPGLAGALNGTTTSVTIPAGILREGRTYKATISVWKTSQRNTASYAGATGLTAYVRKTEVPVRTVFTTLDTYWFGLMKRQLFVQNSSQAAVLAGDQGFGYTIFAHATDSLNITAASGRLPNSSTKTLVRSGASWGFAEKFNTQAAVDSACPNGPCTISLTTLHNGVRQVDVQISAANFPPQPYLANWDEANRIDPTKAFNLVWALGGGAAGDFVQVRVEKNGQTLFKTGDHPKAPGALTGLNTSVSVPAGIFAPGEEYQASILHLKPAFVEAYAYPKATGIYGVARETTGTIRTRGGNFPRPAVTGFSLKSQGLEVIISGAQGRQYVLEGTKNYANWSTVLTTNAPQNTFSVRLPFLPGDNHSAFRVVTW